MAPRVERSNTDDDDGDWDSRRIAGSAPQVLAWSPDGRYLVSAGVNSLYVWDTASHDRGPVYNLYGNYSPSSLTTYLAAWSPQPVDRGLIAVSNSDGTIQIWQAPGQ